MRTKGIHLYLFKKGYVYMNTEIQQEKPSAT